MAQKSTREGLKKEYVDYLGNLIIDGKIKQDIIDLTNGLYPSNQSFNNLTDSLASEIEARTVNDEMINQDIDEINNDVKQLQDKTRINYLRPTLQTQTVNGVTCTNNGDGTYTLNGTATNNAIFKVNIEQYKKDGNTYKLTGCPKGGYEGGYGLECTDETYYGVVEYGDGVIFSPISTGKEYYMLIVIYKGYTANNLLFKPMLTYDLNATYDDFVSGFDCLTPDLKMDLLWTNASPTSAFASQTISLDLSKYKAIIVTCKLDTSKDKYVSAYIPINNKVELLCPLNMGSALYETWRTFEVSNTGIHCSDASFYQSSPHTIGIDTNGTSAVPVKIWGVR